MALNISRYKTDLARLIEEAELLVLSFHVSVRGVEGFLKAVDKSEKEEISAKLKALPSFSILCEAWYSECIAFIKQVLPDRLVDFKEHFEIPKNRKDITYATYRIQDALNGLKVTRGPSEHVLVDSRAALPHLQQQIAILKACERRFESSLYEIKQLVQAELFDSEIDSARHLLKNRFLRAAGAVAGVVLEKHLLQVCEDHMLKITKKNPGINDLNQILKDNGVIDVPQWRHITLLGDIRNICDHNKQNEPTEDQVSDLIAGTDKVLKTIG